MGCAPGAGQCRNPTMPAGHRREGPCSRGEGARYLEHHGHRPTEMSMAGFFFQSGRFCGEQSRKAGWLLRSLTGSADDAWKAEQAVGRDLARKVLSQGEADPDPAVGRWLDEVGGSLVDAVRP